MSARPGRLVLVGRSCVALVLEGPPRDGHPLFADFLLQNSLCFWNACLIRSVSSLEYRGCLAPATLLVSGTDLALEVVRSAWARRVLRPPRGYAISKLGDVGSLSMVPVAQTQFAPLPEALCKVVVDLSADRLPATASSIRDRLAGSFPDMQVPGDDILHRTLGALIRERKLYHNGNGYSVVTPDTYRLQRPPSPPCERPMLLSNEEAIVRLHGQEGRTRAVQVDEADIAASFGSANQVPGTYPSERTLSLKARKGPTSRGGSLKGPNRLGIDIPQSEKQSMLAKLLRLLTDRGGKHPVFSAQFPPLEWLEAEVYHSIATQTKPSEVKFVAKTQRRESAKMPWQEGITFSSKLLSYHPSPDAGLRRPFQERDGSSPKMNQSVSTRHSPRNSPSHRYSHGTLTKRKHKHRRSSSESPRVHKNTVNGSQSHSASSKSNSDDKTATISEDSSKKCQKLAYKPFDLPEWKQTFNYLAKNEAQSENSARDPPSAVKEVSPVVSSISNVLSKTDAEKSQKMDYKPFDQPEWKQTFNYLAKNEAPSENLVRNPSSTVTYVSPVISSVPNVLSKTDAEKSQKMDYKPFDQPEWKQTFNYLAKSEAPSKNMARNPPSVLKDVHPIVSSIPNVLSKSNAEKRPEQKEPLLPDSKYKINRSLEDRHSDLCLEKKKLLDSADDLAEESSRNENSRSIKRLEYPLHKPLLCREKLNSRPRRDFTRGEPKGKIDKTENSNQGSDDLELKHSLNSEKVPAESKKASEPLDKSRQPNEIVVDNTVSVEVAVDHPPPKSKSSNISTTIVTEETTITKANGNSKVVTVTSITTSVSPGGAKESEKGAREEADMGEGKADPGFSDQGESSDCEKPIVNDLNLEKSKRDVIDCTSSCNIVTEVK